MGRIKKVASSKHGATVSPAILTFTEKLVSLPLPELPSHLQNFPRRWPFPRGDLYHWIDVLDRFDSILERFIKHYDLQSPQTRPFNNSFLESEHGGNLQQYGFGPQGDELLVDKVQRISSPSRYLPSTPKQVGPTGAPKTPKGKDRATRSSGSNSDQTSVAGLNDIALLDHSPSNSTTGATKSTSSDWMNDCTTVEVVVEKPAAGDEPAFDNEIPDTPTRTSPLRRSTTMGSSVQGLPANDLSRSPKPAQTTPDTGTIKLTIGADEIRQSSVEEVVAKYIPELPPSAHYELLNKVLVSKAILTSRETRQFRIAIQLLAVSNLSYIYPEHLFHSKVLQYESELPKRLQLISQLAELLARGSLDSDLPVYLQTLAFTTLRALAKHKARINDILTALSINVNHGVLMSATRKGLTDMEHDNDATDNDEGDEWREALFSLLHTLVLMSPPPSRSGDSFVPASMIMSYVDVLNLRTEKAQRVYLRILEFFETFCHTVKDGINFLSSNRAVEAVTDLVAFEVDNSLQQVQAGKGLAEEFRSISTDYRIPYFHQQTIRFILPFIDGVIVQSGTAGDRILRNLIDSPALLAAFKSILEHGQEFGSHVWSSVVKVTSSFLHNEPTSYTVLAEADLPQTFLASIGAPIPPRPTPVSEQSQQTEDESRSENADMTMSDQDSDTSQDSTSEREPRLVHALENIGGANVKILPSAEAIANVSQAFSAICLTTTGYNHFRSSGALSIFFDVFQSPAHVKSLTEANYLQSIGNTFDELARHHPGLRMDILSCLIVMVAKLRLLGKFKTLEIGAGIKLWTEDASGKLEVAGGKEALWAESCTFDLESTGSDYQITLPNSDKLNVEPAGKFSHPEVSTVTDDEKDNNGLAISDFISPVMWILLGFFENQSLCSSFVEYGGGELILDIAAAPSLPFDLSQDGNVGGAPLDVAHVIHMMADTKAHVIVPSLMNRLLACVEKLEPFSKGQPRGLTSFFEPLISSNANSNGDHQWVLDNATKVVRHLASTLNLTRIFHEVYSNPMYHTRQSQQPSPFSSVNLVDRYTELCRRLGEVQAACVREAITLQAKTPREWREETRLKDFATGIEEADKMLGLVRIPTERLLNDSEENRSIPATSNTSEDKGNVLEERLQKDKSSAAFVNVKALRSLLSQTPYTVTQFFEALAVGLVPKRRMDTVARQNMTEVADAMAKALVSQLEPPFFDSESEFSDTEEYRKYQFAYLIVILASLLVVVLDSHSTSPQPMATTSILASLRKAGGMERVRSLGEKFYEEARSREQPKLEESSKPLTPSVMDIALSGLKMVLEFFSVLASSKTVVETTQATALKSPDRDRPYWFVPSQLLLELRMDAVPLVRKIWSDTGFINRVTKNTVEVLIFALRHIMEGDSEGEALKAADHTPQTPSPSRRTFVPGRERLAYLRDRGYDEALAREALFRCNNSRDTSEDYCLAYRRNSRVPRNPVPPGEFETSTPDSRSTPRRESSAMSLSRSDSNQAQPLPTNAAPLLRDLLNLTTGMNLPEAATQEAELLSDSANGTNTDSTDDSGPQMAMSLDNILNPGRPTGENSPPTRPTEVSEPTTQARSAGFITIEDLEAQRTEIRSDLVEHCLEVLNTHYEVAFELSELVRAASKRLRIGDKSDFQSNFGSVLVSTLVSTQSDLDTQEGSQTAGKKVAAHAHLLAFLIQDKDFYAECLDSLKDSFPNLLGFIKITQASGSKAKEVASPWVARVLLIIERMLSDDAEPAEISWNSDSPDSEPVGDVVNKNIVTMEEKKQLFDAIIDILPSVGKDSILALSIVRVLAILTRERSVATMLGEKRNIQRLFLMIKQLGSDSNERVQATFMIVLRHIIEDDEVIRQIMRSEIIATFETRSHGRQIDTTAYVRQLYHLVLRSPRIFVEVTSEKLKIPQYDRRQRPQTLALKDQPKEGPSSTTLGNDSDRPTADQAVETTELGVADDTDTKPKSSLKVPVVEHPDGVIHYLLSELMSYKDVEDKNPIQVSTDKEDNVDPASDTDSDSAPIDTPFPRSQSSSPAPAASNKPEKAVFKADEHPIYLYRCFLLQCLTELLHSYNRTKIEFVSFSRRADPSATTPSKARSGVLNYLLHCLIPMKSLTHDDSYHYKKRQAISDWAMRVVIALCSKTGELGSASTRDRFWNSQRINDNDDEEELNFVREFVLQHAMKAFKEANSSTEPLDGKYAKMLGLAELFNKLLAKPALAEGEVGSNNNSYKTIGKMMFQKNFISILTASIADLDLSFSGSKRLAKSILKPLEQLATTALQLSLHSDTTIISPLGQTEQDEISSASSVSEMDDEREETPDLFRNSALGMMDPNREDMSESEDDEDDEHEMYDEDYDDEMEYEEELGPGDGEVVSDEDVDEMDGPGPIEGLPGDVPLDLELVMEDEDDVSEDEDDDDDVSDDDDDEEIEMDEDDAILAGEINGDDENASLADDDGDIEWESDNEDEVDGDLDPDDDEADIDDVVDQAASLAPGGPDFGNNDLLNIVHHFHPMRDVAREVQEEIDEDDDIDNSEGEGEGEDLDENDEDAHYHTLEEILDDDESAPWAWDDDIPPPIMRYSRHHHHHHHHHFRAGQPAFTAFGGATRGLPIGALGRSRHPPSGPRGNDDGINPLLERPGDAIGAPTGSMSALDLGLGSGLMISSGPGTGDMFEMIMQAVQRGDSRVEMSQSNGRFDIRFDGMPHEFRNLIRGAPPSTPHTTNTNKDDPIRAIKFNAVLTVVRWQEEAKLLYGGTFLEKTQRVINSVLKALVPEAIEETKARQKLEEEARKREEEERERERQERMAREEAERKRKEEEEREAAARATAEAEATAAAAAVNNEEAIDGDEPMQDAQAAADALPGPISDEPVSATDEQPTPRVYTTIRGRQLDITDLAIDPEFLEELPEEIREEVIMQQYAEQRHQAQEQGQPPTEINSDFLDALPDEIREELLQQEAAERRRRERDAARRRVTEADGPARAEEMDPDSFMASLDPSLRRSILADQPEEIIAGLAPEFAAEARQLFQTQLRHMTRAGLSREPRPHQGSAERQPPKEQKKQVVQMVDKAGVATLLRLMFMPQSPSSRTSLHNVLHVICEHRQTRGEVISLILLILQEGTADITAIERSLAHLSLRARTPTAQKTPQPLKRTLSMQPAQASNEVTPIMIVQQCLSALEYLTSYNPHIAPVFLRELDSPASRSKSNKKGKGKETRASKYALNSLLSLLDRSLITDNASCMETLSSLLQEITKPLPWLLKKEKTEDTSKFSGEAPESSEQQLTSAAAEESNAGDTAMTEATPLPSTQVSEGGAHESTPVVDVAGSAHSAKDADKMVEEAKPKRLFEPPAVPEQNLRLVVGVLAARECNSKIFRDTLSSISYLSNLPGAKEIFGKELINQAQTLSQTIIPNLDELSQTLQKAQTGPELHGLAVEKFTTPSSEQTKFLRVLTALDYLFDPKRDENKDKSESEIAQDKEDLLASLYERSSFGPVWSKLSECLTIIRQKEGMMSVATILLPLIESLMVVCKNTSLKNVTVSRSIRERSVQSPAPDSGIENLFYNFTEEHRKIMNELVRINPKLMSGSFSLLVKNPKVLEFDNKRNYFTRQLHSRAREARHPQPPLQLSVRRDQVFLDSFKSLYFKSAEEMKYGKLSIRFHGEEGVDAGGVTREWFQVLARGMFNPDYALFIPVASDRTTFHPNRLSGVNNEHLMFFKFIGRIIGKALYEGRVLDCHFSRAVYKCILGKSVSIKDMETLDLDYYKSLVWMLENDITDIITETFSVETDDFGEAKTIDLIENGHNIPVTEENKQEYVQLVVEYRLTGSVNEQLEHFLKGFHDIIPAELISIFNEQELELLISGLPDIDVDDWRANTEYHNYSASSQQIQWFWRAVRSFDKEEQAKLLQFVTGTSKVPLNGFKELEGMNGFSRFNIHKDYGNKDRLPSSHTCFNQLDLPEYDSYDTLRQRLHMAMTTGSEYFGFA
ncbi:putative ubiquitin-protein ligase [Phaeomoniella chlamydospora]|uniref:HECT-type E3 ubiquitin transferase n=1 Tax=Phaeomoniella chlamydospora TaxID=158046 RepID=A0A0G2H005_PHACM|nr:putative ubiquitin-protein ligase [Phaeomoniella chlamydospora]